MFSNLTGLFRTPLFSSSSDALLELNISSSIDDTVEYSASLVPIDENSSSMTIILTDTVTGRSQMEKYNIGSAVDRTDVLFGGVENFKASNGKIYTLDCAGSRNEDGKVASSIPECP